MANDVGALVLAAAWLGLTLQAGTEAAGIPLTVVVHDDVGVSADDLDRARQLASGVFNHVGVDVIWMDTGEFVRSMPVEAEKRRAFISSTLQIRIMSPSMSKAMALTDKSLAMAVTSARFAWIAFDKVRDAAAVASIDLGDTLGYVMAHEIGHLLLPPNSHSAAGLMREDLDPMLIAHNRVLFLDADAVRIRATLEKQVRRPR